MSVADSSNTRLDAARRYADERLTQAIRAAGITEEDEAYAWGGFQVGPDSFAGRLRIRAVAGFPHEGQLDAPTMEEMTDCGLSEDDARAYIEEWSLADAARSLETSLFMSAACIAGARAIEARAVERPAVEWFDDPEFQEWLNELAENMGDEWDRDEAMIAIVVDYVRYLESLRPAVERLVAALRVLLDAQFRWDRSLDLARGNARRALAEFGQQPTGDG